MRNTSKKLALSVIAAGAAALSAAGVAKADFVYNVVTSASTGVVGDTDYVIKAFNNGTNSSGTVLLAADTTLTIISGGNLAVDFTLTNPSTDTYSSPLDADILGSTQGFNAASKGTFSNIGSAGAFSLATVIENGVSDTSAKAWLTDPGGTGSATQTVPARYSSMTSLEIAGFYAGGVNASSGKGANLANVVVPSAAVVRVQVAASGTSTSTNGIQYTTFTLGGSVTTVTPTPIVSLTSTTPAGYGSSVGGLTVTGSNGKYVAAVITRLSGNAGYSQVSGFSPAATETEIFLLKLSSSASDSTVVADINAANGQTGGLVASLPTAPLASLNGIAWDIELTETSPAGLANGFFGFNLGNETNVAGLTVQDVAAVPEPATLGLLALSGIGLLARRRRA